MYGGEGTYVKLLALARCDCNTEITGPNLHSWHSFTTPYLMIKDLDSKVKWVGLMLAIALGPIELF